MKKHESTVNIAPDMTDLLPVGGSPWNEANQTLYVSAALESVADGVVYYSIMKSTVLLLYRRFQDTIHSNEEEEEEEDEKEEKEEEEEEEEKEEEEVEEQAFGSPPPTPSFLQFTGTPSLFHYTQSPTIAQVGQVLVVPLIFLCSQTWTWERR